MSEGNEHFISSESALSKFLIKNYSKKKLFHGLLGIKICDTLSDRVLKFTQRKPFTVD